MSLSHPRKTRVMLLLACLPAGLLECQELVVEEGAYGRTYISRRHSGCAWITAVAFANTSRLPHDVKDRTSRLGLAYGTRAMVGHPKGDPEWLALLAPGAGRVEACQRVIAAQEGHRTAQGFEVVQPPAAGASVDQ